MWLNEKKAAAEARIEKAMQGFPVQIAFSIGLSGSDVGLDDSLVQFVSNTIEEKVNELRNLWRRGERLKAAEGIQKTQDDWNAFYQALALDPALPQRRLLALIELRANGAKSALLVL